MCVVVLYPRFRTAQERDDPFRETRGKAVSAADCCHEAIGEVVDFTC